MSQVLALCVGKYLDGFRGRARLQPGQHGTHFAQRFREPLGYHLHERIQGEFLTSADYRQQLETTRRDAFPQEAVPAVARIGFRGEHAAQVQGTADRAEHFGKQVEGLDIHLLQSAEENQLFWRQTWIFAPARFVPGLLTDRADQELVPASFKCRRGTL